MYVSTVYKKKDVSLNAVHVKDICQNILLIILANSAIKKRQITGYYKAQTYFTEFVYKHKCKYMCQRFGNATYAHIVNKQSLYLQNTTIKYNMQTV